MRIAKSVVPACLLLLSGAAWAQDAPAGDPSAAQPPPAAAQPAGTVSGAPVTYTKDNYPGSFVDRPLILPMMMAQPEFVVGIIHTSADTGEALNFAFDMGVMDKLQAGALLNFPVNPNADFGYFLVNGQYGINEMLNARLDIGASKQGDSTGFTFGIGAPIKYKLNPMIALTSGRPYAYGAGDDIIQMTIVSGAKVFLLVIPVGLLAQVHEMIAVGVRTGFRFQSVSPDMGDSITSKYVPLAFDGMVNIIKMIDVGFTFELAGNTDDYAGTQNISIWAQARF